MSEHSDRFISHLMALRDSNRGALAVLRHSVAFAPGDYPRAYPYVERFVGADRHESDVRRLALYAVAGLYARHPDNQAQSIATACARLYLRRDNAPSIEQRFVTLLGADADSVLVHLRHIIALLAAHDIGLNYGQLLDDLTRWLNRHADLDRLRQRWARDFYRALAPETKEDSDDIAEEPRP